MSLRSAILFSLLCVLPCAARAQQVLLGVLEQIPPETTSGRVTPYVRVLFEKTDAGWKAFPSECPDQACLKSITAKFPAETKWTVAFDGKSLGEITAHTPKDFAFYSHVGLQEIVSKTIPSVGKPTAEFGASPDRLLLRPLAAVSPANFKDPVGWKRVPLSADQLAFLRKRFQEQFPKLCRISPEDETKIEPRPYTDADIQLLKAYGSNSHWTIARLHVDNAIVCGDPNAGYQMPDPWFAVSPEHSASYLASGLYLIDAGDYDNSGHSQLLFSFIAGDNRAGYILYFDNFSHSVTFSYSFH